ncbi:HAD family hydrolase [Lentilactobacillus diolivorans]|uniref:Phosphoglycolate phosphatase n=2 Tax=Lentilactobacillus diolivorans TaxID=179838 RepID=A0A0R1S1W7_9LACO|nr:HAD hydrolase-like protein [Lentilactobacillus diolivorans]KRL63222.1 phosphoglycolate phosphatase [Lentilactobacillus diolivorans DSM 14421]GEP24539.1 phosphoglycolate phosphatase [Lentilactobacillus diolivorans]
MYKVVAFDLDGTIAETFPVIFDSFRKIVYKYTNKLVDDKTILATFGANEIGMLKKLIPDAPKNILDDFYKKYRESHRQLTKPFDGITKLIDWLKNNDVIIPMVTGKGSISSQISLEQLGMSDTFSPVLIGSADGPNKIDNFKKLLKQYQITPDEMAYVADTVGDVKACREVEIACYSAAWSKYADAEKLKLVNENVYPSVADLLAQFKASQ